MALDFVTNIFGGYDTRDNLALSITEFTEERAVQVIQEFLTEFNAAVDDTVDILAAPTTDAKTEYGTLDGGEMQAYREYGEIEATRQGGVWDVAYPIRRFRDRTMYTEEFVATENIEALNRDVVSAAIRNQTTRLKMVLRAILLKANYTFADGDFPGSKLGSLTIRRLFNNDSQAGEIVVNGVATGIGTLQHYITSGGANLAIDDFAAARDKLKAVGLGNDVVYLMAQSLADDAADLTEFVGTRDARVVDPAEKYAIVRSPRAIGYLSGAGAEGEIVVMPFFPDNYFLAIDRAGPRPVAIRQHRDARFQGFRLVQDQTRASYGEKALRNKQWEYIAGAGVRARHNGVAVEITADATYDDPTI